MKYLNKFNENVTGTMSVADKMEKAKKAYDLQIKHLERESEGIEKTTWGRLESSFYTMVRCSKEHLHIGPGNWVEAFLINVKREDKIFILTYLLDDNSTIDKKYFIRSNP